MAGLPASEECPLNSFELSAAQVAQFRRDGCLIVRNMFNAETVTRLVQWTNEVRAAPETPGRHMVYYEDDMRRAGHRIVSRIENFCPHFQAFDQFLNSAPALDCIVDNIEASPSRAHLSLLVMMGSGVRVPASASSSDAGSRDSSQSLGGQGSPPSARHCR